MAGGYDNKERLLSSTEVLTMDASGWTLSTPLPRKTAGLMGVTLGGRLYITGEYCWTVSNILILYLLQVALIITFPEMRLLVGWTMSKNGRRPAR